MNALNPVRTVEDQITEAIRLHDPGASRQAAARRAGELLERVGIGKRRAREYPHTYSGGMRQRAMIALALACDPDVIVADEPTTALDVMIQAQILELLGGIARDFGMGIILVTHDLGVVAQTCDRVVVMYGGVVAEENDAARVFAEPQHPYTQQLLRSFPDLAHPDRPLRGIPGSPPRLDAMPLGCRFAPRCPHAFERCAVERPPDYPAGGRPRELLPARPGRGGSPMTAAAPPLLRVEDLVKAFPGRRSLTDALRGRPALPVRAVDGISFELRPGEVLALVGESGCGKTTTGNLLMGLERPTSGRVVLNGEEVGRLSRGDLRRIRRQAQMVFQDPYESLNPRMTVARDRRRAAPRPRRRHLRRRRAGRVEAALGAAGLTPVEAYLRRYPWELSGGQRQRVVIAAALALEPALLIADEPVSMLDVSIRAEILNLLAALAHERGIAVVMITHDLSTVAAYADRIAVMYLGRIVEQGPTRQVLRDPRHPYAQALLSVVPMPGPAAAPAAGHPARRDARPVADAERLSLPPALPGGVRPLPGRGSRRSSTVDGTHAAACLLPEAGGGGVGPPRRQADGRRIGRTPIAAMSAAAKDAAKRTRRLRSRATTAATAEAATVPASPPAAAANAWARVGEATPV